MLGPNRWEPTRQTLNTVVTLDDEVAAEIAITETQSGNITLTVADGLTPDQRRLVRLAVTRMLRLNENLAPFHKLCRQSPSHRQAAQLRFGRLLRSSCLFEDMVKVVCTCNVTWRQTVTMVENLVNHWGVPVHVEMSLRRPGKPRSAGLRRRRGFPTPQRLARVSPTQLKQKARVGYRAPFIHRLARQVADGTLDLDAMEQFEGTSDELFRMLRRLHGIGDYAASHLCMLLGRYDRLAVDTEMMRFLSEKYPKHQWTPGAMKKHYVHWHPFQFLAYWFELWCGYVAQHGQSDQWGLESVGRRITRKRKTT